MAEIALQALDKNGVLSAEPDLRVIFIRAQAKVQRA
jgi:hypothetical protein